MVHGGGDGGEGSKEMVVLGGRGVWIKNKIKKRRKGRQMK